MPSHLLGQAGMEETFPETPFMVEHRQQMNIVRVDEFYDSIFYIVTVDDVERNLFFLENDLPIGNDDFVDMIIGSSDVNTFNFGIKTSGQWQ